MAYNKWPTDLNSNMEFYDDDYYNLNSDNDWDECEVMPPTPKPEPIEEEAEHMDLICYEEIDPT